MRTGKGGPNGGAVRPTLVGGLSVRRQWQVADPRRSPAGRRETNRQLYPVGESVICSTPNVFAIRAALFADGVAGW